ncbi:MAG: 4Fe-4S dicluster domain-containing protein [Deltaproteobacteria bacterium]|nr:4Fe-4S dicluster domain-containing protein [Deltaproteobacteria bacterium]
MKGMLIDSTKCIGCRGCQIACKQWNNLPAEKTEFFGGDGYQNPGRLSSKTWTLIKFNEIKKDTNVEWIFSKQQCFHCIEPSCVAVCPVCALLKTKSGAVIYDPKKCIGCRYCQLACPFDIPCFDWDKPAPEIKKCNFCFDRIENGKKPACAKACPADAITFGERDDLIREAEIRIADNPNKYINHIYGRFEAGGSSILHIAGVSFDKLGFRSDLPQSPAVVNKSEFAMKAIPYIMTGLGILLGGCSWIINRRNQNEASKTEKQT